MDIKISLTEKGKPMLIIDEFKFREVKVNKSSLCKWRCTFKSCNAVVFTNELKNCVVNSVNKHNHEKPKHLERQVISNKVKQKASQSTCERPSQLVRQEISAQGVGTLTLRDVHRIKQNVYKSRRLSCPKIAKDIREAHGMLKEVSTLSDDGEEMLLFNDEDHHIIAFATRSNIVFLSESDIIFIDGTFKYCVKHFYQLFTVHTLRNNQYVPLVFFLLPNKKPETYTLAFNQLMQQAREMHCTIAPNMVVADFEIGLHEAVINVWPSAELRGCRFHLSQSWYRKIQDLKLAPIFNSGANEDAETSKWLHWVFGLALLPPHEVSECFVEDLMSVKPNNHNVTSFCDYLVENYIAEDALFPPKLWASMENSGRTTNACESFHATLHTYFYQYHPDMSLFVSVLKHLQNSSKICQNSTLQPKQLPKRARDQRQFLAKTLQSYRRGQINRFEYVKCVCHHYSKLKKFNIISSS